MAAILHMAIKVISIYSDYKYNYNSTTAENKTVSDHSKYTISLGAAIFFAFMLITGMLVKSEPRHAILFYFLPLQLTFGCAFFPMSIILWNPKLKKKFLELFPRPVIRLPSNRIATIS